MSESPPAGIPGVAIIGMAGRFPGAPDLERFWDNLREGVEGITFLSEDEVAHLADPQSLRDPSFVRAEPLLEGVPLFDAGFFDMTPREAELTDPQHRLFLECALEALESAGCSPAKFGGSIGVYAGCGMNYYLLFNLLSNPGLVASVPTLQLTLGADKDYLCTRVSYKLNLRGPSLSVQTACSTSLVAVHLACQGLLDYQCDLALAGGVSLKPQGRAGYRFQEGGIVSPDGHCRPFDSRAQGTVFGSGLGAVVLKRLEEAIEDRDPILAVILGSAVNNDGSVKVGYTAPGAEGQVAVISEALRLAEVDPDSISYIEAHGTGTPLGDPIEISALTKAFRAGTQRRGFCAVGSAKSSIGHLDTAAGVAGLIKTVLALRHGCIPPTLHFERPNPQLRLEESPFFVSAEPLPWRSEGGPRRAGVSSFGIGGTNAHVILEEAPPEAPADSARPWQLLPLSARTPSALEKAAANLAAHLRGHPDLDLADAAYTLQTGRTDFEHRRTVVCRSAGEAAAALELPAGAAVKAGEADPWIVFLFPGQGAQQAGAGRELYDAEPVFRAEIDRCAALLQPRLGLDVREALFDPGAGGLLERTALAQPALFSFEYALARLWMKWGVKPAAMIGHSLGEYVAACLAGVFSLEDALALVAARGRLMQALPAGSMRSVPLSAGELEPLLAEAAGSLALAAENGPSLCIVSGEAGAVEALAARVRERGLEARPLRTSHAFHSAMMDPAVEPFREQVARVRRQPPRVPFLSNRTGSWIRPEEATDPRYWAGHLRDTVRFAAGLAILAARPEAVLLEVGPGQTLSGLARRHPALAGRAVVSSLPRESGAEPEARALTAAVGQLWLQGVSPDWEAFHAPYRRRRVRLPSYPFERRAYWIEPGGTPGVALPAAPARRELADWFYAPIWRRSLPAAAAVASTGDCLLFEDSLGVGARMAGQLQQQGVRVVRVTPATAFDRTADDRYSLDPRNPADYRALVAELRSRGALPDRIVHLWSLTADDRRSSPAEARDLGFFSLLHLAQTLGGQEARLIAVSNGIHEVTGEEELNPEKATLLGPVLTIAQEYPGFLCRAVDVWPPPEDGPAVDATAAHLLDEMGRDGREPAVALRGRHRWERDWSPVRLEREAGKPVRLRPGGTYLITGGLGGLGLVLAEALARAAGARLVLTGRSALPERERWDRKLLDLEALGAEVLVLGADVTDAARMEEVVSLAEGRFGAIHGVFHAAGEPGGGLIQRKDRRAVEAVFAPKIDGARVLDEVFRYRPLDFLILCSSTFALHGGVGLVDYSAANAFLDTFAHHRSQRGAFTLSVDWDGWEGVGMRARGPALRHGSTPGRSTADHPLLGSPRSDGQGFIAKLTPADPWPVAEHRVLGSSILPGTAYLEIVRAALRPTPGDRLEILELELLSPCVVAEGGRELWTELRPDGDAVSVRVLGRTSEGEEWREHARGRARLGPAGTVPRHEVAELLASCSDRPPPDARQGGRGAVEWGARWDCVREVRLGSGEALALLEIPELFADDLEDYPLHPALLDVGTSFAHLHLGKGGHLPVSYRGVTVHGPLPRRLYSHARLVGEGGGEMRYRVTLLDEEGTERVAVEEIVLRRLGSESAAPRPAISSAPAGRRIQPGEGAEAWMRLLGALSLSQVAVSPRDLPELLRGGPGATPAAVAEPVAAIPARPAASAPGAPVRPSHPRPALETPYAAPRDPVEEKLAGLWRELLGLDRVGVHDNFFELGGDSVLGIQLFSRARQLGLQLTTSQLFERQTVAELAAAARGPEPAQARAGDGTGPERFAVPGLGPGELAEVLDHVGGAGAVEDVYPLSPLQEGMLFHSLANPRSGLYFDQLSGELALGGGFDPTAFRRAWLRVVERHPVLRTAFLTDRQGRNVQAVLKQVELRIEESDWRAVAPEARQERVAAFLREDRERGFEMSAPPLMRLALFDLEPGLRGFVLSYHHILMDAWSVAVVLRDVVVVYQALRQGIEPRLETVRPYRDFIDRLRDRDLQEAEEYWRRELAGLRSPTRVPGDRERPAADRGAEHGEARVSLPPDRTEALQAFARRSQLTVSTLLQAAWAVVLSHRTGREDVCFGAATSGRTDDLEGVESMVGLFVSSLPVRVRVRTGEGLLPWLKQHQARQLQMRRHEGSSLLEIQGWSEIPGGGPLFDSILAFVNHPVDAALRRADGDLQIREVRYGTRTNYPLSLLAVPGRGLSLRLTYDGGRFEPATAASLIEDLALLLEAIPESSGARVADLLETIAGAERRRREERLASIREILARDLERALSAPLPSETLSPAPLAGPHLTECSARLEGPLHAEAFHEAVRQARERHPHLAPGALAFQLESLGEDVYRLEVSAPALALDGEGLWNLLAETAFLYGALVEGGSPPPPAPPWPLLAAWQAGILRSEASAEARRYWREHARPQLWDVELPFEERGRAGFMPQDVGETLDFETSDGLAAAARATGASLTAFLLTAWQLLLSRLAGRQEIAVGVAFPGRTLEPLGAAVGSLARHLPVVLRVSEEEPLAVTVRRTEEVLREHAGWQQLYESAAEGWPPIQFEARAIRPPLQTADVRWSVERESSRSDRFKLRLAVTPDPGRIVLDLAYDNAVLSEPEVRRMLRRFRVLLASAASRLEAPVEGLEILDPAERVQVSSMAIPGESGPSSPLPRRFEERVDRAPEAMAVTASGERLTYRELDGRANRLARHLLAQGLRPGQPVGLCLERSADMVVAILAVLKTGACYLPLDPAHPLERLTFALTDSGAPLLITQDGLADGLADGAVRLVRLDAEREEIAGCSAEWLGVEIDPEQPAYVIYTSGSTGRPKGVVVSHRNVDRLLTATDAWFGFGPDDVWTLFHSYAFDFSVWEIWGALLYGGRLVVVPYWESRSPEAFYRLLREERVTVLNQTPSAFRQLLWAEEAVLGGEPSDLALRWVIFGGEALEPASLAPWFERHGDERPRLVNMYGITETTVHVTWRPLSRADSSAGGSPIGAPIPDLSLFVLDPRLRPQPVGVPGELFVGGEGLALGYLGRPDLTAERFVPDPWGPAGSRLYRSGDLARRLSNGDVDYLGRIDHQVKIRGFRIELGEIEASLATHPAVREALVVARDDGPGGERRLVAYLVPGPASAPGTPELREHLAARLPEYMLPAAFVTLDRFPLTVNGKIDRDALPAAPATGREGEEREIAESPSQPVAEILAGIWAEVLGSGRPSHADNFLSLGGHSLLATQVASRVRQALGVELPLPEVLGAESLADMAARLAALLEARQGLELPPIQPAPRQGSLPVSFAQNRLWVLDQLGTDGSAYNVPLPVRLLGPLSTQSLARALSEVVRRHESLRTTFADRDGQPVQIINPPAACDLTMVDLGGLPAERARSLARRLLREDAERSFDLGSGPLFRILLLRLSGEEHLLLLALHHIISDRWSLQVLLSETAALYEAMVAGRPSPLSEPILQYVDFAVWQREWLQGEALERLLDYWRAALAGAPEVVEIPGDLPRPQTRALDGASVSFELPAPLSEQLRSLGQRQGATLFMTLFAACCVLVGQRSGLEDVVVGTDVANRNRRETEGMIGFFVNQVVLRSDLSGDPGFSELIHRVRKAAMGAYLHQDLPFDKLLEALRPGRDPGRTPLFQVKFVLQNIPRLAQRRHSLTVVPESVPAWKAKFDLLFNVVETPDGIRGSLEYSTDLYTEATIREILADFESILRTAVADPEAPLSRLDACRREEAERRRVEREQRLRQAREEKFTQIRRKVVSTR
ncbi:MAG: amino acid adenylation domain-containing protein [Thermoanaerobaculia bacterium]